jgi:GNAT superfamily N-acetyltransferase
VSLEIVAVDAADAEQLAAYHATYHAAHTHGREYATAFALEEVRAQLLTEGTGELNLAWSGLAGGEVVTSGSLWAPLDDNTHMATVEVGTRPADRRRGYGSAMLEHLVGEVRRLGRRTVLAEVSAPYDGPADGRGHPNVDFVLRRGFEFALGSVMRVLDLPADEGRLKRLAAEAEPHHRGYEFLQFRGAVPEDIIEAARLDGAHGLRLQWSVIIPLITPQLFFLAVTGTITSLQSFGQIHILTRGGPDSATTTLVYSIYEQAFANNNSNFGYASAQAIVLLLVVLAVTAIMWRLSSAL